MGELPEEDGDGEEDVGDDGGDGGCVEDIGKAMVVRLNGGDCGWPSEGV